MKILEFFSKYRKLIITAGLLVAGLSFIDKALGVGIIFVFFLAEVSLFFIEKCKEDKERRVLGTLFLAVFSLHILIAALLYYTHFQPFNGGGGDFAEYQNYAQGSAAGIHVGNFSPEKTEFSYYPTIVGYIYAVTLPNMLIGQLFNAWLATMAIIFVYLIVREIGGTEKEGFLIGLIACLYPSFAFYGDLLLKDAMVIAFCMVGLLLVLKIIKRFSLGKFIILYLILIGLTNFRFYVSYAITISFIICWLLFASIKIKKRIIYGLMMILLFGFIPQISSGYGYFGIDVLKHYINVNTITFYRETVYAPPTIISQIKSQPQPESGDQSQPQSKPSRSDLATPSVGSKGSSIVIKTGFNNPLNFVKNNLYSFAFILLGPFPWQLTQIRHLLVLPEVIAWYFLLFFIIKGIIETIKKRDTSIVPLIIFSCLVFGTLALFISNFGITTRIRIPAVLSLLCIFPFGFQKLRNIKIPLLNEIF